MKQYMSISEYSRHAGISRQNLHKHLRTGLLSKTDGRIEAEKADAVLKVLHGESVEPLSEGNDYLSQKRQAEARYRTAKAAMAELDLSIKQGEYKLTKQVQDDLSFVLYGLKQRLTTWSKGLPPKLAFKDGRACMKVLEDETYFILSELSKGVKSIAKSAKSTQSKKSAKAKKT
jgi:hypothetical protein